jgi:hypothetical protein
MSTLAVTAITFTAVWLGILTLVVVILVRQTAILAFRQERVGSSTPPADTDGLAVGLPVPPPILAAIPEARSGVTYVLLTSASCTPCRELVPKLVKVRVEEPIIALAPGRPELADSLAALFPPGIRVIRDPQASELAQELKIQQTPFAIEITAGHVTGKSYLRSPSDLRALVNARRAGSRPILVEVREDARNTG